MNGDDLATLQRVATGDLRELNRDIIAQVLATVVLAQQIRIEALEHELDPSFSEGDDSDDWWRP